MKKIMFNDKYGLTRAVLEEKKTMTRRNIKWDMLCDMLEDSIDFVNSTNVLQDGRRVYTGFNAAGDPIGQTVPAYGIGEEVAIAQSYEDIYLSLPSGERHNYSLRVAAVHHTGDLHSISGWTNKMFVKGCLMSHCIRIVDIKVERIQDISDEDCLKEGIYKFGMDKDFSTYSYDGWDGCIASPKDAFANLIDRVSGRGTWKSNPWVFAYTFELSRA